MEGRGSIPTQGDSHLLPFLCRVSPQFTVRNRQRKLGVGSGRGLCNTGSVVNETSPSTAVTLFVSQLQETSPFGLSSTSNEVVRTTQGLSHTLWLGFIPLRPHRNRISYGITNPMGLVRTGPRSEASWASSLISRRYRRPTGAIMSYILRPENGLLGR